MRGVTQYRTFTVWAKTPYAAKIRAMREFPTATLISINGDPF
jgi:hypothetical protein